MNAEGKWGIRQERKKDKREIGKRGCRKKIRTKCERQGEQFRLVEMHRAFWQKYGVYEQNTSSRHCKLAIVK